MLTQAEVKSLFNYDPESGALVNRVTRCNRALAGDKVGSLRPDGYLLVSVNKKRYLAHRIIWLWIHGYFPENQIDHISRNPSDNRLSNLREVTQQCNLRNAKQKTNNISGVTGVCWDKQYGKWRATITVNNRGHYLGLHQDFTEAVLTRLAVEQCLNWEGCDSSSDAFRYLQETRHGQRRID